MAFTRWTISITVSQSFNRSNKRWTISCRQFGKQHFSKEKKRKKKREIKNTERERERGEQEERYNIQQFLHTDKIRLGINLYTREREGEREKEIETER